MPLNMDDEKFINHARVSFSILRWGVLAALLSLPFTFSEGPISPILMASVVPVALGWLATMVMAWRSLNPLWLALSLLLVVMATRLIGLDDPRLPKSHSFQWLCYLLIVAGFPLLVLRARISHLSRLDPRA